MAQTMKAAVMKGIGQIEIEELLFPSLERRGAGTDKVWEYAALMFTTLWRKNRLRDKPLYSGSRMCGKWWR